MKYFGIKTPGDEHEKSYIYWITSSEHSTWMNFFTYPNRNNKMNPHSVPLSEAIKAYKAIGYECIELEVKEKLATETNPRLDNGKEDE